MISCALLSKAAAPGIVHIHDRMPVVITPEHFDAWLDPNTPGPDVQAINNLGQITGFGIINGQTHAFLATPVPIPGAALLLAPVLLGLVGFRRKFAA